MTEAVRLTGGERKVLAEMARGRTLVRDARSGWRVGTRACRVDLLDRLKRNDLVESAGEGFRISGPGMAHLQRRDAPEAPNRMLENAADHGQTKDAARAGARQVNRAEEPLAWLHARGKITDRQFEAGERLRGDFHAAGQSPRVTMAWDPAPVARGKRGAGGWQETALSPGERQVAAKDRLTGALAAAGTGLSDVLTRTICAGEGLETAERAMGWPARSGKVVLCLALDRVADFYRL